MNITHEKPVYNPIISVHTDDGIILIANKNTDLDLVYSYDYDSAAHDEFYAEDCFNDLQTISTCYKWDDSALTSIANELSELAELF